MNPREIMEAYGLNPKKSLGQNFMHDPNTIEKIVVSAEIMPGDTVVEIGPGTGELTARLGMPSVSEWQQQREDDWEAVQAGAFEIDKVLEGEIIGSEEEGGLFASFKEHADKIFDEIQELRK